MRSIKGGVWLVAAAALYTPEAYGICDHWWGEHCRTRVEQTYFDGRRVWPPKD